MDNGKYLTFMAQGANEKVTKPNMIPQAGMIFSAKDKPEIIFMAVVDGWIMAKKKGKSIPFVYTMPNFTEIFIDACGYQLINPEKF